MNGPLKAGSTQWAFEHERRFVPCFGDSITAFAGVVCQTLLAGLKRIIIQHVSPMGD